MATAEKIMETDMLTAELDETVSSVAYNMAMNNVGAALVVQGERLRGIFSERDLLKRVIGEQRDLDSTTMEEVATLKPVHVKAGTSLRECAAMLQKFNIRHLPVVDEDMKPLGIISSRDFLRRLTGVFERTIDQVDYEAMLSEGQDPYDHMGGEFGR